MCWRGKVRMGCWRPVPRVLLHIRAEALCSTRKMLWFCIARRQVAAVRRPVHSARCLMCGMTTAGVREGLSATFSFRMQVPRGSLRQSPVFRAIRLLLTCRVGWSFLTLVGGPGWVVVCPEVKARVGVGRAQ